MKFEVFVKYFKIIVLIPCLLMLSACAVPPERQALSLQDRNQILSNKTIVNTTQRNVRLQANDFINSEYFDPDNPMDSGAIVKANIRPFGPDLITGIIITAMENNTDRALKKAVAPIQNALSNFDYLQDFKNNLEKNLSTLSWLHLSQIKIKHTIGESEKKLVRISKQNTVLFVGTTYALNSTFERLMVSVYVKLDLKLRNGQFKTLYQNDFNYIYRLNHSNSTLKNKLIWTHDHASFLISKLQDASVLLSHEIVNDLNNPNQLISNVRSITHVRTISGHVFKAQIVKQKNGYYFLSLVNGGVIYIVNMLI